MIDAGKEKNGRWTCVVPSSVMTPAGDKGGEDETVSVEAVCLFVFPVGSASLSCQLQSPGEIVWFCLGRGSFLVPSRVAHPV